MQAKRFLPVSKEFSNTTDMQLEECTVSCSLLVYLHTTRYVRTLCIEHTYVRKCILQRTWTYTYVYTRTVDNTVSFRRQASKLDLEMETPASTSNEGNGLASGVRKAHQHVVLGKVSGIALRSKKFTSAFIPLSTQ